MSLGDGGVQLNGASGVTNSGGISGDGRYVLFQTVASNAVAGDSNGFIDVFRETQ
ncbi:MAG: hypothetical protein IPK60_16815 [Sandaracinaceae bacterium]|nr:hypothetical protein [Sandaracinaceae bacterium]